MRTIAFAACVLVLPLSSHAQTMASRGRSIGAVSTSGNVIIVDLDRGALARPELFDLAGRTLRFVPVHDRYRVQNEPLQWNADTGHALAGAQVTLTKFAFPFSDRRWTSFLVGTTGSIRFGRSARDVGLDPYGKPEGGIALGRFDQLAEDTSALIDSAPAICVFLKPRLTGARSVQEMADRVIITWDLTEPFGGILDFHWFSTTNRFQAVLHRDGAIEMSYQAVSARDAIVGLYPTASGAEQPIAALRGDVRPAAPPALDLDTVRLTSVDGVLVRVAFVVRGGLPASGAPAIEGTGYRIRFDAGPADDPARTTVAWTV
ncbi:MAG: hypothetical protein ACREND_13785, partial [Gemmatimonadaceae bacterium]